MYFVHPQIQLKNALKAKFSLLKSFGEKKLKEKLGSYFPAKQLVFTDMGRTAFRLIIEKLNLQNSQILLPAYICDIFYPIFKEYNIKPIFLDINLSTFHIKTEEIVQKITPKTKAILVCHTYGLSFDVEKIKEYNLLIIEDCAHSFLVQKGDTYAGNFGDVSFFSLYKQFPALRGGMLVCPNDWNVKLPKTFFNFRDLVSFLNYFWPFALFFKKFGSEVAIKIPRKEKGLAPAGINRASLSLFADFFGDVQHSLATRKKLALLFQDELKKLGFEVQEPENNVFCYLSVLAPKSLAGERDEIIQGLKKYRIFCTRIWHAPIILNTEVQKEYQINLAEFPSTIEAAKRIINFPLQNYYQEKDIKKMIEAVKKVMMDIGYPSNGI